MNGPLEIIIHPDCGFEVDEHYQCRLPVTSKIELQDAEQSAKMGCPWCILCYTAVTQIWPDPPNATKFYVSHGNPLEDILIDGPKRQTISFAWDFEMKKDTAFAYCFYGFQDIDMFEIEKVVPCDTSSAKSLHTVRLWIKECDEEHDCLRPLKPTSPRRVLNLRDDQVRLLEITEARKSIRYACLSHCWGNHSENMLRTTSLNLSSFKNGIAYGLLPRTFQDAVLVARQLGLVFLWIDSLCIVQDDVRDWQEQSAIMADIYQNAYITLAATAYPSADEGLYTSEDSLKLHRTDRPPLALVRSRDGIEREVFARLRFNHSVREFPLLQRGWVYQERILSPRILHFAGDELIWECHGRLDCECGYGDLGVTFSRPELFNDNDGDLSDIKRYDIRSESEGDRRIDDMEVQADIKFQWRVIAMNYTALSLTYPSDIFPALSGIVKAFALKTHDEYIAGLWKRTLVSDLLWFFETSTSEMNINVQEWRAPSWSWASVNTNRRLFFFDFSEDMEEVEMAHVRDVVCQPSGADPTGQLKFAHLTLSTKAISARLKLRSSAYKNKLPLYILCFNIDDANIWPADGVTRREGTGYSGLSDPRLANRIPYLDVLVTQIACSTNSRQENSIPDSSKRTRRYYMILAKQIDQQERWVRVGLAFVSEFEPDRTSQLAGRAVYQSLLADGREELLEETAKRNREILRLFDEAETQDVTIW
jgi:hypothetical protein